MELCTEFVDRDGWPWFHCLALLATSNGHVPLPTRTCALNPPPYESTTLSLQPPSLPLTVPSGSTNDNPLLTSLKGTRTKHAKPRRHHAEKRKARLPKPGRARSCTQTVSPGHRNETYLKKPTYGRVVVVHTVVFYIQSD
jgi:hypothetical protein